MDKPVATVSKVEIYEGLLRRNAEGPMRKFALIKTFGRTVTNDPATLRPLSCKEIEAKIEAVLYP
jgi:hypothetical protein